MNTAEHFLTTVKIHYVYETSKTNQRNAISTEIKPSTSLVWDVTRSRLVFDYGYFRKIYRSPLQGPSPLIFALTDTRDKWVSVTTARRVLRLWMNGLPIWRVGANILNKQSSTA